jgi:hypothetical protein
LTQPEPQEKTMKRFDFRILLGGGLMLIGLLLLLEKMHIISGAAGIFWGGILLAAGVGFGLVFLQRPQARWWAIIPAMALLGAGASAIAGSILPRALSELSGGFFLGALGIAFFIVYATDRSRWWGIIPGGVLLTLACIAVLQGAERVAGIASGSLFFLGLGLTFLLVAILPNPVGKMQWAYIPAAVLVVMGALLGSQATAGLVGYIWPAVLILIGVVVLIAYFFKKD